MRVWQVVCFVGTGLFLFAGFLVADMSAGEVSGEDAYEQGRASFNSGSYDRAIEEFTLAIKSPDRRCLAYANRARSYLWTGDRDGAASDIKVSLKLANQALQYEAASARLYEQRAWVYIVMNEIESGMLSKELERADDPQRRNLLERAAEDLGKAIEKEPNRQRSLELMFCVAWQLERWETAILACDKILDNVSGDRVYREYRAHVNLRMGNWQQTITDCNTLLENSKASANLLTLRGAAYTVQGDFERAVSDFEEAMKLAPEAPMAYWGRSVIRFARGDMTRALLDVEHAVTIDPPSTAKSTVVLDFFTCLEENFPTGTIEILDRICAVAPKQGECFLMRSRAHLAAGSIEQAKKDYLLATRLGILPRDQMFSEGMHTWLEERTESKLSH